jgi:hypothetical protein
MCVALFGLISAREESGRHHIIGSTLNDMKQIIKKNRKLVFAKSKKRRAPSLPHAPLSPNLVGAQSFWRTGQRDG